MVGVAPKRNVFRGKIKILLTRPLKKSKIWLPNLNYQLKNNLKNKPSMTKSFTKDTIQLHMSLPLLWHEFDNCLWNFLQSKASCCLHMYFLWGHHLCMDTRYVLHKVLSII
jgi:hypothetical protein